MLGLRSSHNRDWYMARLKLALKNVFKSNTTYAFCFTCLIIFTVYYLHFKPEPDSSSSIIPNLPEHGLCVLVPCRQVFDELLEFIPLMNEFLNRQSIKFHFIAANHVPDGNRFNKGAILNAGYKFITEQYADCDYIAFHDVDLIPLNDNISYAYPGNDIYHVANPEYHPFGQMYDAPVYTGGIVILSNKQYLRMNGFSNNFWGWAAVDWNFYFRMRNALINRVRPTNLTTDRTNTFKHIHSPYRIRDGTAWFNPMKNRNMIETEFKSGISDVKFNLISVRSIKIDEVPLTMLSMSIPCDYSQTPWCKLNC